MHRHRGNSRPRFGRAGCAALAARTAWVTAATARIVLARCGGRGDVVARAVLARAVLVRPVLVGLAAVAGLAGLLGLATPVFTATAVADVAASRLHPPAPTPARAPDLVAAPSARVDGDEPARWAWPTGSRVVLRPWEAPADDYAAGHRGIDVSAALGTTAVAVDDGIVSFAGQVAGRGVVTVDHGGGLVSTLDSVAPLVTAGDEVTQGDPVGRVTAGHCPASEPCLHLGARVDVRYVDPTPYLPEPEWPVLLPEGDWPG